MKAEIISVGTEILLGEITDTNASYIAHSLPTLGIDLYWISQVGDNQGRLVGVLRRAWGRSDLTIITGGLGPTQDDITREAIAEMLGETLSIDPQLEQWVRGVFARRRREMPQSNLKQAMRIPSAQAINNPVGTAPGWWVEREGRIIVAMPGVPSEMYLMWNQQVVPRLRPLTGGEIIVSRTLKVGGMTEAAVDEAVAYLLSSHNPTIGTYARQDGIHLRFTAKAKNEDEAQRLNSQLEAQVRQALGRNIWGADEDTWEGVIGDLLKQKGLTLAVMESCTGGYLANTITNQAGSSAYFKGGIIAYSNEVKIASGVDAKLIEQHGAVSSEVAAAMAEAVRKRLNADIGLSTTGVAGPDPLEGQPVGTVYLGVDIRGQKKAVNRWGFTPNRPDVKRLATIYMLMQLRNMLMED